MSALRSSKGMKTTVTFDFDNTIVMSYMDIDSPELDYKFQGYNKDVINVIIDGNLIMHERELLTIDTKEIEKDVLYFTDKIKKSIGNN